MRTMRSVLLLGLAALLLTTLPAAALAQPATTAAAPRGIGGDVALHGFPSAVPPAVSHSTRTVLDPTATAASGRTTAPARTAASAASSTARAPTALPAGVKPGWSSPLFFNDINISFSIPFVGAIPFSTVPATNQIPEYATGFWMNISTIDHVPLLYANVTIWGSEWPVQNYSAQIPGYGPNPTTTRPMWINPQKNYSASFFFDDDRYFWPGDTVNFNVSVQGLNSIPAQIFSASGANELPEYCYTGTCDEATWIFFVQGPWVSPDFASSVQIHTTPDVLTTPPNSPNRDQKLQISLTDIAPPGLVVGTIPAAQLYWTYYTNRSGLLFGSTGSEYFGPANATTVTLNYPIGPYPNDSVEFNVTAWLPWQGGAIDRIYSPNYWLNWSSAGGWNNAHGGLLSNLILTTVPQVLPPASGTIPAGQPVNVTLHEPLQNVTISSAQVNFVFHDGLGSRSGVLPMQQYNPNTTYVMIPGLPPGASLTWFASAKDLFGNPVFSQNFTYSATHSPPGIFTPGRSIFFFEALDVAGTGLVPALQYTISNASWQESSYGTPLGFGAASVPGTTQLLTLGFGPYLLSVSAFNRSWSTTVVVSNQTPFTVTFYVASGPVEESSTSALPAVPVPALVGLAAAAVSVPFVAMWFAERRKRIEEEQRRITL
ncbi:MAG TPA: hypothetical protein VGV89_01990 [Thermoplasmata archaeon]|nr:hypothetical protein [Thermoplasmata archaeon]